MRWNFVQEQKFSFWTAKDYNLLKLCNSASWFIELLHCIGKFLHGLFIAHFSGFFFFSFRKILVYQRQLVWVWSKPTYIKNEWYCFTGQNDYNLRQLSNNLCCSMQLHTKIKLRNFHWTKWSIKRAMGFQALF